MMALTRRGARILVGWTQPWSPGGKASQVKEAISSCSKTSGHSLHFSWLPLKWVKRPKTPIFGASISKAFAGGQKWMVVTHLSEWYVTGAITVWCRAVYGGYRELGKDWFLCWADTHKEENSSKGEREEVLPHLSSLGGEGDEQCLASFVFPMCV